MIDATFLDILLCSRSVWWAALAAPPSWLDLFVDVDGCGEGEADKAEGGDDGEDCGDVGDCIGEGHWRALPFAYDVNMRLRRHVVKRSLTR